MKKYLRFEIENCMLLYFKNNNRRSYEMGFRNKSYLNKILILSTIFLMVISSSITINASYTTQTHNTKKNRPIYNTNYETDGYWAGYATYLNERYVMTQVSGYWIVPQIQGSCPSTDAIASVWLGIDGYNTVDSGSLNPIQVGTNSICKNGNPSYNNQSYLFLFHLLSDQSSYHDPSQILIQNYFFTMSIFIFTH